MHNSTLNARKVRTAHNELATRFEQVRALDWPLTTRDQQPLYNLIRRMLGEAEGYLEAGEMAAAMQSITVGGTAITALSALRDLETMEV